MHSCAEGEAPTLLCIQMETNSDLILLFREDCWVNRNDGKGSKSTILMRYSEGHMHCWRPAGTEETWVFVRSTNDRLIVGAGGKEGVSLVVLSDLYHATTQRSEVFLNDPLQETELFTIRNAELYAFVLLCVSSIAIIASCCVYSEMVWWYERTNRGGIFPNDEMDAQMHAGMFDSEKGNDETRHFN